MYKGFVLIDLQARCPMASSTSLNTQNCDFSISHTHWVITHSYPKLKNDEPQKYIQEKKKKNFDSNQVRLKKIQHKKNSYTMFEWIHLEFWAHSEH